MAGRVARRVLGSLLVGALLGGCGDEPAGPTGAWQRDGADVPIDRIESYQGEEHCDWQAVHFLHVAWPLDRLVATERRQFVRDPEGALDIPALQMGFRPDADLPPGAAPTGYVNDGTELWFAPSDQDQRAYLVSESGSRVEAWPRSAQTIGCD
jgi:hypothetical protein